MKLDLRVGEKGTGLTAAEYQICMGLMEAIDEMAPSDSWVNANVDRQPDGLYQVRIRVRSSRGRFATEAETFSLVSSFKQAQRSMLRSLDEWKRNRFNT